MKIIDNRAIYLWMKSSFFLYYKENVYLLWQLSLWLIWSNEPFILVKYSKNIFGFFTKYFIYYRGHNKFSLKSAMLLLLRQCWNGLKCYYNARYNVRFGTQKMPFLAYISIICGHVKAMRAQSWSIFQPSTLYNLTSRYMAHLHRVSSLFFSRTDLYCYVGWFDS